MNKMRPCRITALILAAIAIILLVVGIYGMTRPMSYGSDYYHAVFYDGEDFNGTMTFYPDNTMMIRNTNFDEDMKLFYYYKNGYVFFPMAQTEAEYQEEVAAINADFEGAVNAPFYGSKINAFRLSSEGPDGYKSVYICQLPVMMLVVWGAIELALIGFVIATVIRGKKEKCKA